MRIGDEGPLRRVLFLVENVNEQVPRFEEQKRLFEEHRMSMNEKV